MDPSNKAQMKPESKYTVAEEHFRGLDRDRQITIQNLAKSGVVKNFESGLDSYNFPKNSIENVESFMILCAAYPIKDEDGV